MEHLSIHIVASRIRRELFKVFLCELSSTWYLVFAGLSVNAQYVLSEGRVGNCFGVSVGWGLVLTMAILMGQRTSGAHLNPAVSFMMLIQGTNPISRFFCLVIAQSIGAFIGAATTFVLYYDAINQFDNGTRYVSGPTATAGIFATYPRDHLSTMGGVFDQILGTAILCIGVAVVTDKRNNIPPLLQAIFMGCHLSALGLFMAYNAGYAINPARDFAPRLFTYFAGYGSEVFSYRNYNWFWIPLLCPMIGAILGAWAYQLFIGMHEVYDTKELNLNEDEKPQKAPIF